MIDSIDYKEALDQHDDWTYLIAVIYGKMKAMAHDARKDLYHENKLCIRQIWQATRPLKRAMSEEQWPADIKTELVDGIEMPVLENKKTVWVDRNGRDTGVRSNGSIADVEAEYFKAQMAEFGKLMGEHCRNWWW